MQLIAKKGIRGRVCHAIHQYGIASHKYMKDYDKTKEQSYLKYFDVNNSVGQTMLQKFPVNIFEWI